MRMHVLVTGAAGSGTSTLARALSAAWAVPALEADDFFWMPTDPPYTDKRAPAERRSLLLQQLGSLDRCVVAGSVMGWGNDVEEAFDLVIFLYVPPAERLRRLRERELARFGRVNPAFLEWAGQYDEGPPEGRSLAKHEAWLRARRCPVLRLVGEGSVAAHLATIAAQIPAPLRSAAMT
ncbi:AAA family ATPase [Aquabacterium sp. A7-Y]|uniref:AAA family ATPase n=1 Tax=Aquabacterium sp. A7-Y TaxID=1349605 RepID=UPI00223D5FBD|nr:AAA family ATPase [Aquabacterium sp. A7-Y]MCW7541861.1 AAA family ATPase [Aquabacterium sp. A7-Y]